LSDCGADGRTLKRFGGWKSDTVVGGYVEDSLQNKIGIAKKILGNGSISPTSIVNHEITIVEQNKEAGFDADKEISICHLSTSQRGRWTLEWRMWRLIV
jgi:hypothetical protein